MDTEVTIEVTGTDAEPKYASRSRCPPPNDRCAFTEAGPRTSGEPARYRFLTYSPTAASSRK